MRKDVHPTLIIGLLIATAALVAASALRYGWVHVGASAATPALLVVGGAIFAACLAVVTARVMQLSQRASSLFSQPPSALDTMEAMLLLADRVRAEGVLTAAADESAKAHKLSLSGLHLLCDDADRKLVRSALETQAEIEAQQSGSRRAAFITILRIIMLMGVVGLLTALTIAAWRAGSPWQLGQYSWILIAGTTLFASSITIAPRIISNIRRCTANEELDSAIVLEAISSIQSGDDRETTITRLRSILPSSHSSEKSAIRSRRAA